MSTTFEDYGYTVADFQSTLSTYLHPVILFIFCHGIHTCIFFIALYYIVQSTQPKKKRITLASIIAFLWSSNTVIVGVEWKVVDDWFITNGKSLEDEFDYYLSNDDISASLAADIVRALNTILADVILIWRCWVLYGGSLPVVTIPSVCFVTETISVCIVIAAYTNSFLHATVADWTLVYYSMTVMTNSLCTFLILFRIVRVSGVGASLKTYRRIIEILVESAAMYAVIYVALLVAYACEFYGTPPEKPMVIAAYLQMMSISITGIAPTLIIACVMAGHSRPDDSWTRPSLPHLRTPMRSLAESLRFASVTERSTADNDAEQAREPDVERDGVAEASDSASHDSHPEGKSSEAKVDAMAR